MNIHQVLFFCFLSALQDGNTGLTNAVGLYAGAEGGRGSIQCHLTSSGNTKFFCKGECKEENILIKTDNVTAQSGRYSIRSEDGSFGRRKVTVTITQLTKSDSGRYRCGLGRSLVPDEYRDFDLIVIDEAPFGDNTSFTRAGTEGGSLNRGCNGTVYGSRKFFCKGECKKEDILIETEGNRSETDRYTIEYIEGSAFGLYVTIRQLNKSDTGWYKCGYGRPSSPDSSHSFQILVVDAPTTEEPTSVPSASAPATTQSLTSSSGSFTPSSSFPETTEQFAELQDGNTGLSNAVDIYAGAEGGRGSIQCSLTSSGNTKFFCKGENILIKTDNVSGQIDRYSITSQYGSSGRRIVTVTITQLMKSDSGRYRYGLGGSLVPDSYCEFDLRVTDEAPLGVNTGFVRGESKGGSVTRGCGGTVHGSRKFLCKDECEKKEDILVDTEKNDAQRDRYTITYSKESGLSVTITQLKQSDTGQYRCGYGRPSKDSSYSFSILVVEAVSDVSRPGYFWPLVVCVPAIVVLVAVVLLFVYKLKMMRNSGLNTRETSDSRNKELSVVYVYHTPVHHENRPPVHYESLLPAHYKNRPPGSMSEDPVYQSVDAADMDPDHIYSTLRETANM